MREDIKDFTLSGMGCSASLVAFGLVQHLFKTQKKRLAIVVTSESIAANWYCGRERSMMLSSCLFRARGCSMFLTNDNARKNQAILKLKFLVRTQFGSNDEAYNCAMQFEDGQGYKGFRITKSIIKAVGQCLSKNFRVLLPKVLPLWEIIRYTYTIRKGGSKINLKAGIKHFCFHPGGRAVIDEVGASLGLNEYDLEPARMALHHFGNPTAAGVWYVLGYMEAKKRLKKRDIILMMSLGAGFKSNNCIWEVMKDMDRVNVWKDMIENFPKKKMKNTFLDKYGWINNEAVGVIKPEQIAQMMGFA